MKKWRLKQKVEELLFEVECQDSRMNTLTQQRDEFLERAAVQQKEIQGLQVTVEASRKLLAESNFQLEIEKRQRDEQWNKRKEAESEKYKYYLALKQRDEDIGNLKAEIAHLKEKALDPL